jgi:hypothetical protein
MLIEMEAKGSVELEEGWRVFHKWEPERRNGDADGARFIWGVCVDAGTRV